MAWDDEDARREAKRRFGKGITVRYRRREREFLVKKFLSDGERHEQVARDIFDVTIGRGNTWEEAIEDAERWREAHPEFYPKPKPRAAVVLVMTLPDDILDACWLEDY